MPSGSAPHVHPSLKPRAGPAPPVAVEAASLCGRPLVVAAIFLLGLGFPGLLALRQQPAIEPWINGGVLALIAGGWALHARSCWGSGGAAGLLGSVALVSGLALCVLRHTGLDLVSAGFSLENMFKGFGILLLGIAFDRSEQISSARASVGDAELLRTTFDSVADPVLVVDDGCRVRELNWLAELAFPGVARGQLACETPPFQRDACAGCPLDLSFESAGPRFFAVHDERGRPVREISAFPVRRDGVALGRLALHVADVTGRTQAAERMQFLADVVESVQDAVFGLDAAGRVTYANQAARRLLADGGAAELEGCSLTDVLRPATHAALAPLSRALSEGRRERLDLELEDGAGRKRLLSAALDPVRDPRGRPVGLALLLHDVTEERSAAQRLARAERLSVVGAFLSGLAHELNNPLAVLCGASRMLLGAQSTRDPGFAEAARRVHEHAERCRRIVHGLLRFVRGTPPARGVVDVNRLLERAAELLGAALRPHRITLAVRPGPAPLAVEGDEDQLEQVLFNLVLNARDAILSCGRGGRVTLRGLRHGGEVVLEVADDGSGVPHDVLPRLFEPFFTTKPPGRGTGLGLPLAREIAIAHGGRLEARNRPRHGAVFRLALPAAPAGAIAEALHDPGTASRDEAGMPPLRVLAIDDEEGVRFVLRGLLEPLGHRVETAADVGRAKELLGMRPRFDAVVCDRALAGEDGADLYREIVAADPAYRGRFVWLSGALPRDEDGREGLLEGPRLAKPFSVGDLVAALGVVSRAREPAGALTLARRLS